MSERNNPYMDKIQVRLVLTEGSKEKNQKIAEEHIKDTIKTLDFNMDPKMYILFFNLLYDEWNDATQALTTISDRIRLDYYLTRLLNKKRKYK